jgi:hypothetical protein
MSEQNKQNREYQTEKRKGPEFRTKVAEQRRIRYKEKMKDPVYRAKLAAQQKERRRNPDVRTKDNARRREWYREKVESDNIKRGWWSLCHNVMPLTWQDKPI